MSVSPMDGVSAGAVIRVQDEGTDLAFRRKLNFKGAGVSAAINGDVIDVTVSGGGSGSSAFEDLTSGTNTTATMVVGTGASLTTSGSGTITATAVPVGGISGLGTGIATALAVNVGTAGAPVVNGGALGTPSSGTLTNATGLPVGGISATGTPGATNYLRGDGTWAVPAGAGDVIGDDVSTTAQNIVAYSGTGGKNITELTGTQGDVLYHNGTNWAKLAAGTSGHFLKTNGPAANPAWAAASGGSSTWDTIGAAAGDGSTANGDNNIVYQVAKTTNSEISWRFTESAAATNGTSTSGVPNQVLLQLDTVAASTMSPLKVLSRGSFVFAVSPTAAQILVADGSSSVPSIAFASDANTGMFRASGNLVFIRGGAQVLGIGPSQMLAMASGTAGSPIFALNIDPTTGLWFSYESNRVFGLSIEGVENTRFRTQGVQFSKAGANAVSYTIDARKSRGTVASPTVITTGDDLLTISGYGYVGSTNTYQEAARITLDSTGTISDSTTGIGGIIRLLAAKVGAEPAEIVRFTAGTTTGGGWMTLNEADANPGTADLADGDEAAVYMKAGNIVFAQNVGGTINFLYAPLDGATTTWTANTTGP